MQFNELSSQNAPQINSVSSNEIVINDMAYTQAICIQPTGVQTICVATPHDLRPEDFQAALNQGADVLLVGTGSQQQFLSPFIMAQIAQYGIGIECMNTAAACRTYTLLTGEGRSVWAWLWL